MCYVGATITTDNISTILTHKAVLIPFSWSILLVLRIWYFFFWFIIFTFLSSACISARRSFLSSSTVRFSLLSRLRWWSTFFFELLWFIFRLRWKEVFNKFTFLTPLPSVGRLNFRIQDWCLFNFFWLFRALGLLSYWKLVRCQLEHFQT